MPGLKKKWIQENEGDNASAMGDDDIDTADTSKLAVAPATDAMSEEAPPSPVVSKQRWEPQVINEKRKRFVPPSQAKLNEWLENNFEQRTEETINLTKLYQYFTEICQGDTSKIVDVPLFNKTIKDKFGKSFGLKEGSVYKSVLKEKKLNQQKKASSIVALKEPIFEALNFYGNPSGGVRFNKISQFIGTKYPAIQIEQRQKKLKHSIEIQVNYDKIDLIKGIGRSGFYRIAGQEPAQTEDDKKKVKKPAKNEGESMPDNDGDNKGSDEKEDKESQEGDDKKVENGNQEEEKKKPIKPKKPLKPVDITSIPHGSPVHLEDIFPLAIAYQSAPKAAGIVKVRNYITNKYNVDVSDKSWRSAVERGIKRGQWEQVSGSGSSGSIMLLMDDFDPLSDELEDQICGGIIACHEPKSASVAMIKKYIVQYHEEFNLENRPEKLKKALLRAEEKKIIVRLSGLGGSGSFQLATVWTPSPTTLAGEDEDADSDEDEYEEEPVYLPKGTKSRGRPKIKDVEHLISPSRQKARKSGTGKGRPAATKAKGGKRGRPSYTEPDSEEEEEEEEVVPKKKARGRPTKAKGGKAAPAKNAKASPSKRGRKAAAEKASVSKKKPANQASSPRKKSPAKKRQRSLSPITDEEDAVLEYTPVKSKSRGRPAKSPAASSSKNAKAKLGKGLKMNISTSPKKAVFKVDPIDSEIEDDESEEEYTPRKSSSRGSAKKASPAKRGRYAEDDESDDEPEYTPVKSASRGGKKPAPAKAIKAGKKKRK